MEQRKQSQTLSKHLKLSISLDQQSKDLCSLFLLYAHAEIYRKILKLSFRPYDFTSYKTFLKNKKRTGTRLPTSFSARFLKKNYFSHYNLLTNQISLSHCLYLYLSSMSIVIVFFSGCDVTNFEISLNFLIKSFSYMTKKVRTKI